MTATEVTTQPTVTVPAVQLLNANGQMAPDQRFMVLMIDIDVIQNNVATTVLHWFQPDLAMQAGAVSAMAAAPGSVPPNTPMVLAVVNETKSITGTALPVGPVGQANYLPPGPPPGPPHRYVQVLFAQPKNFSVPACFQNIISAPDAPTNVQQRVGFDISQFLAAGKINPRPIAGNYFRAQNAMPGSLTQAAAATALRNNMCPGVAGPAGVAASAPPGAGAGVALTPGAPARRWVA
jgi:phosphatidylethanolamine-binding protein (PEBP) family uncharacterized protein